jgi:hypothetical protein
MRHYACGYAGRERVEKMFDWVGALVTACQYRRFIGMQFELLFMRNFLLGSVEAGYRRAIMIGAKPLVRRSKFTIPKLRVMFNGINGLLQLVKFDTVNKRFRFFHRNTHHITSMMVI